MLALFETPAGFALFKCLDDGRLTSVDSIGKYFENENEANKMIKLKAFSKFENTTKALEAASQLVEGSMTNELKGFLKKELKHIDQNKEILAIADSKLGKIISKKFNVQVLSDNLVMELMRGIRSQMSSLLGDGITEKEMNTMALGLSHSLSRYKLKFSPDKVDTMIIQAIALLDDLDKELNTYAMRLKEWYGWHFPELSKILIDNLAYAKVIRKMGFRTNAHATDFSDILPEDLEKELKDVAEISMGTEISDQDLENIHYLADQIISLNQYRAELSEYLKNRMMAIAPNLTCLLGELVGARLISHAGSLLNLAKHPASTVQILGAEKALFRALKTKQNTPKYGLIYHASLVGQAAPKMKGKIARVLAAKSALAVRVDALSDPNAPQSMELGSHDRLKVEQRLRQLERRSNRDALGSAQGKVGASKKYEFVSSKSYNPAADMIPISTTMIKNRSSNNVSSSSSSQSVNGEQAHESKQIIDATIDKLKDVLGSDSKKEKKGEDKKQKRKSREAMESSDNDDTREEENKNLSEKKKSKKSKKSKEIGEQSAIVDSIQATDDEKTEKKNKKKEKKEKSK